jgi:hypothetical protein
MTPRRVGWAERNGKEEIGLRAKSRGLHGIRIKVSFSELFIKSRKLFKNDLKAK